MSKISVDAITDEAGTGAPNFPNGLTGDGSALTGINAYKPVSVTGTTPSLNVGDYNFFNQGALTADTTVSFTSVPTNARWQYSYIATVDPDTTHSLAAASYSGQDLYIGSQELLPQGVAFSSDGTSFYIVGSNGDDINQYDMSAPYDVSKGYFTGKTLSVNAQDTYPEDLAFSPDGTKLYVVGRTTDAIYQYTLSTAWDVSTGSYASKSLSVSSQAISPAGMDISPDGTKVYICGNATDALYQYTLSTPFDVSTGSYASKSLDLSGENANPRAIAFSADGRTVIMAAATPSGLFQYTLSTPFDVSTGSYASIEFGVDGGPTGLAFGQDGKMLVICTPNGDSVYNYNLGAAYTLTLPAAVSGTLNVLQTTQIGGNVTYDFVTDDGGTTVTLIGEEIIRA